MIQALGFIRDKYLIISLDKENVSGKPLSAVFEFLDAGKIEINFEFDSNVPHEYPDLQPHINRGCSIIGCNTTVFYKASIPDNKVSSADGDIILTVKVKQGEEYFNFPDSYSINRLFFNNFSEFQKKFSYAKGRHVDSETVKFIATNNLSSEHCYSPSIWITSFSIYCYKSISLGSVDVEWVRDKFDEVLSMCDSFSDEEEKSVSVRVDFYSRILSVTLSLAHIYLFCGELVKCNSILSDLCKTHDILKLSENDYNFSRVLAFKLATTQGVIDTRFYKKSVSKILSLKSTELEKLPHWYLKEFSEVLFVISQVSRVTDYHRIANSDRLLLVKESSRVKTDLFFDNVKKALADFK